MFIITFIIVASVGFTVSVINAYDAQLDVQAVKLSKVTNGREVIATSNLRTQIFRAIECAILVAIAVLVLADAPVELRRAFSTIGLTIVSGLVIANSIFDRLVKHRLLGEIYGEIDSN